MGENRVISRATACERPARQQAMNLETLLGGLGLGGGSSCQARKHSRAVNLECWLVGGRHGEPRPRPCYRTIWRPGAAQATPLVGWGRLPSINLKTQKKGHFRRLGGDLGMVASERQGALARAGGSSTNAAPRQQELGGCMRAAAGAWGRGGERQGPRARSSAKAAARQREGSSEAAHSTAAHSSEAAHSSAKAAARQHTAHRAAARQHTAPRQHNTTGEK
ncbi:hypothetical protein SLA2020_245210 [Shorea laevis]